MRQITASWGLTIAKVCGVASAVLGMLVLIGWHTHSEALVHVRPQFVPMAYNSAAAFLFGGLALVSIALGRMRLGRFFAVFPLMIGSLTLFQYVTGQRLYLDFLFVQPFFTNPVASITAVAPNSGLGFLLTGVALMMMTRTYGWRGSFAKSALGCMVLVISTTALTGYLIGIPAAYGWSTFLQMAVHTAAGLMLLSVGIIALVGSEKASDSENHQHWAPLLSGMSILLTAVAMGQALRAEEHKQVARMTQDATRGMQADIAIHINESIRSLAFLARLWESRGAPSQAIWEAEAKYYVSQNPNLQAVEWVDQALRVRWVAPLQGNEAALNIKSALEERRMKALEQARQHRHIALTGAIDLVQGGKGFLAYVPIFRGDTFEGFIVGVYRTQQCFEFALGNLAKNYSVQIRDGDTLACQLNAYDLTHVEAWSQTSTVHFHDQTWQLLVAPSATLANGIKSSIPEVVLGAGLLVAILLGGMVHLFQTSIAQSRDLTKANHRLMEDIAERLRIENLLRASETGLKLSQRIGKMGGWELNLSTQTLTWADETYRLFGRQRDNFFPSRDNFYAAVHPNDRARVLKAIDEAIREGHTFQVEHRILLPDGMERVVQEQAEVIIDSTDGAVKLAGVVLDITARKQVEAQRDQLIQELQRALANVKSLSGLLPICSGCKKIRDDKNYWHQVDTYVQRHSEATFTHGMCPDCIKKYFPGIELDEPSKNTKQGP